MKKNIKKKIIIGASVAILVFIIASSLMPKTFETTQMTLQDAELKFTETGMVTSQNSVDVYALTGGELKSVNVEEGQTVRKGQIIAVIDSTDLQNQIKQLQAQNGTAGTSGTDAQIKAQNIVIEQARRDLERAQDNENKIRTLYENGAVSESEYTAAVAASQAAQSALDAAIIQLDVISSSSNATQSSIDTLRKRVADCTIKSPIDGTISVLNVKGTNIAPTGVPIAVITAHGGTSEVEVYISTKDIDSVYIGEEVAMKLQRRGEDVIIQGTVEKISARAESVQTALGATEQKVKVTINYADTALKEGYAVDVDFVYYHEENKLIVPKTAVFENGGKDAVWTIHGGKLRKATVTKGLELRDGIVIESGLNEGDTIVNDCNVAGLKEGVRAKSEK